MKSQKITVVEVNGEVISSTEDAGIADILTTAISTNSALTGTLGLVQRAGLFAAGMSVQSYRDRGSFNFLGA